MPSTLIRSTCSTVCPVALIGSSADARTEAAAITSPAAALQIIFFTVKLPTPRVRLFEIGKTLRGSEVRDALLHFFKACRVVMVGKVLALTGGGRCCQPRGHAGSADSVRGQHRALRPRVTEF